MTHLSGGRVLAALRAAPALALGILLLLVHPAAAHHRTEKPTWADWQDRAVYQLLTDRFASPHHVPADAANASHRCTALDNYCGGTWQGILDQLGYIEGLNLNAIWSSPVTMNSYGGYHGYWPTNFYAINSEFGSPVDLQRVLHKLSAYGFYNILDVVMNHVGHGATVNAPAFKPFYEPSNFNNCTLGGCDQWCNIPPKASEEIFTNPLVYEQWWDCRLDGLPDLNHSVPFVRTQLAEWLEWMLGQYSVHMIRADAAGHIRPEFWPWLFSRASLRELPALLEVGTVDVAEYARARGNAPYSYQSWDMHAALAACFAPLATKSGVPGSCSQVSTTRLRLQSLGVNMQQLGIYIENHDTDRFLTLRNDLPAYRNALAYVLLSDGIPIIYMGAEQGLAGSVANFTNRRPLWEGGFSRSHPLYAFIRRLAWYRWWMHLGGAPFQEHFVDDRTLAFSRGDHFLVVLSGGNYSRAVPRPLHYRLEGLPAGMASATLCNALGDGQCIEVAEDGSANVAASPADEPLVLVPPGWVQPPDYFLPVDQRPVRWEHGLLVTLLTAIAAVLAFLAALYALHCWRARRFTPAQDARAAATAAGRALLGACGRARRACWLPSCCCCCPGGSSGGRGPRRPLAPIRCPSSARAPAHSRAASSGLSSMGSMGSGSLYRAGSGRPPGTSWMTLQELKEGPSEEPAVECSSSTADPSELAEAGMLPPLPRSPGSYIAESSVYRQPSGSVLRFASSQLASACARAAARLVYGGGGGGMPSSPPTPSVATRSLQLQRYESGEGGGTNGASTSSASAAVEPPTISVQSLVDFLKGEPDVVMHVALEYSMPHLGLNSELMFGGLGKVVDTFIRHTPRPMLLCAPMYQPLCGPGGQPALEAPPVMHIPVLVGGTQQLVAVHASAAANVGADGGRGPPIIFLLLHADIFARRSRSTIYANSSEAEALAFFSVFNQAVAAVIQTLGVRCVQLHDYHGALSLAYLPPQVPLRVMVVAHNADYNSQWPITTKEREAWLYARMNLPVNSYTRGLCEHEGRFNMLKPAIEHMRRRQAGLGVVAVSPRYAVRCYSKFSLFWQLPPSAVAGVLNGLDESARPQLMVTELGAFFERKREAKLAFQQGRGLKVGEEYKLLVLLGRITHQKGCDLVALAARNILRHAPQAQIVMVGPLGDMYGERARQLLDAVAEEHPGRVVNGCGQYTSGAEKELLCMATDFFLCPSRFEPCGLADVEFGWLGAVAIGHDTGGLGKVPGFYFRADLDSNLGLATSLEEAALRALAAPDPELRSMSLQALAADFPPARMIQQHDEKWAAIRAAAAAAEAGGGAGGGQLMPPEEAAFHASQWADENAPFDASSAGERLRAREHRARMALCRNLALLVMQGLLQLPPVLCMVWFSTMLRAGSIQYNAEPSWGSIMSSPAAVFLFIYAGSALLCQALGFLASPLLYLRLAGWVLVLASLLTLWALYAPQVAHVFYLLTSLTAAFWSPISAFIFMDMPTASVSELGPAVMGFTDAVNRACAVVAIWATLAAGNEKGTTSIAGFEEAGIVLYILGIWFSLWLCRHLPLAHLAHCRLRLRGQLPTLLTKRRCWIAGAALTTLDSFAFAFVLSMVFAEEGVSTGGFALAYGLTSLAASVAVGCGLSMRWGRRLGLRLMYGLAAIPAVALLQTVLVLYGGVAGAYVSATLLGALLGARQSLVGLLTLHTLPTRETFTLVRTLQVLLGSLAIVLGLAAGGTASSDAVPLGVSGGLEAARLCLVAALLALHRRENLAGP